jgi:hypothetical protein
MQCPGSSVAIGFVNSYTNSGMTFQWQAATQSSVGPFTSVAGGTNQAITTPTLSQGIWYTAVITCTNGGGTSTATAAQVVIAPVTTSSVTYSESFEGIHRPNQLPNCSWMSPQIGITAQTYTSANTSGRTARTGNSFASFYYNPAGTKVFFTNGIWMEANVTYSASLWFQTEYYGYNNWTDLSILIGTSQSTTGMTPIASTNGPAISNVYKSLSNTFSVPSAGLYYLAIQGTGNTSSSAQYLSWDDLLVEIPCSLNSPTVNITAATSTVCQGQPVNLTATGADTYTWSTGDMTSNITPTLLGVGMHYIVANGSNSLSGCAASATQSVFVNPAPNIYVVANKAAVCVGESVNLNAFGALTYSWNSGGNNPVVTVAPISGTSYTVLGSNAFGCTGAGVYSVSVNQPPVVTVSAPSQNICKGESVALTGAGAVTYQWLSSGSFIQLGNPIQASPSTSASYTVTGTDANGCSGSAVMSLGVDECTGLNQFSMGSLNVYPNPTSGILTVEMANNSGLSIEVTDVTGRVIKTATSNSDRTNLDMGSMANGIYYVKIKSSASTEVIKMVKQ